MAISRLKQGSVTPSIGERPIMGRGSAPRSDSIDYNQPSGNIPKEIDVKGSLMVFCTVTIQINRILTLCLTLCPLLTRNSSLTTPTAPLQTIQDRRHLRGADLLIAIMYEDIFSPAESLDMNNTWKLHEPF